MADVSIYWFRDDLRLSDLPGLQAAADRGSNIRDLISASSAAITRYSAASSSFISCIISM